MSEPEQVYNPLDKKNLGRNVAERLLAQQVHPLPPKRTFMGAGAYAIYYSGGHPIYRHLAEINRKSLYIPIYVGKTVPPGARKGEFGLDAPPGPALFNRLNEHADSIREAKNLDIKDFHCRYLVVDDIWIPLAEAILIERFGPVWNKVLDGFGNHDPGKGRYNQQRSPWDALHPGRKWAERLKDASKSDLVMSKAVEAFIKGRLSAGGK